MSKQTPEEENKWLQGLQLFLYQEILTLAEPDPDQRIKLVDQEAMNIWMIAFTHESYEANVGENYEELEKLGDSIMKSIFIKYLMMRFQGINRGLISELSNYYMSKPAQAPIAVRLGLNKWVRTPIDKNIHMFEDLLESLFGALLEIGDKIIKIGAGYVLCYNLLVNIYNSSDIDLSVTKGHAKTQVKQTFEKMNWGKVEDIETWVQNSNSISGTFYIRFTPQAINDFKNLNINVPNDMLAMAGGTTRKVASDSAYKIALNRLLELGITQEWADLQREQNIFMLPELSPYFPDANERARKEGYVDIYFKSPRKGTKGCYVQLIGVLPNNRINILKTVVECSVEIGRKEALRQYAEGV